jgi:DNA-binding response OmpR family regulator
VCSYEYCGHGRVLIVDDDPAIRELLSIRLGVLGYQVATARDGDTALERIQDFHPDAMILDVAMPRLDGFKVLERLGKARLAKLPVLMLTASTSVKDVQQAIRLGAKDYLCKPFTDDQLIRRVARLTRHVPQFTVHH